MSYSGNGNFTMQKEISLSNVDGYCYRVMNCYMWLYRVMGGYMWLWMVI